MKPRQLLRQWYAETRQLLSGIVFGKWQESHALDAANEIMGTNLGEKPTPKVPQPVIAEPTSHSTTEGISVRVQSMYLPNHSSPDENVFTFAYTVAITNDGDETAELRTRHWIITDGHGQVEEVQGDGVVGEQPLLHPGQTFQYTSGCQLRTPVGTMHGSYQMHREDGSSFDAAIAPFSLATPVLPRALRN